MSLKRSTKFTAISRALTAVIIIVVLVIAGAAVYFASSTSSSSSSSSSTSSVLQYKSTIIIGTTDSVQTTIDPADAYDYFGDNMMSNLGAGLVDYRVGTSDIVPALATSWTTSTNGTIWTFTLRPNVKFSDGTPFNATVVKYSIDRQMRIDESAGPFAGVSLDTIINRTIAVDANTVRFVLNQPVSFFLQLVAFWAMYPVNPHIAPMPTCYRCGSSGVVNYTGNVATENPTGLGPYILTSWQRSAGKDIEMDLAPNPNYWNASASGWPKTPDIVIKFFTDSTSLNLALQSGQIDMAYRQLAPTDIQSYQSNANFKVWTGPGTFIQYLVFNVKSAPFNNVEVRDAIASAINRSLIDNTVFLGQVQPLYSMIPAGFPDHTDAFQTVYGGANGNLSGAETLLKAAGYSTSNPLTFTLTYPTGHYSSTDGIASALKQTLESTGLVKVTLASQPWSDYKGSTQADQLSLYMYGWYPDYIGPFDYTGPFLPSDGLGFLHSNYVSTQMNTLVNQAEVTIDATQLANIYSQIQLLTAHDAPMVPLFQGTSILVASPKVSGVVLDATTIFRYYLLQETQ
ncbi:MAG: ABC transporter substrate-binding protein [Nitrososphaerales archaeon]